MGGVLGWSAALSIPWGPGWRSGWGKSTPEVSAPPSVPSWLLPGPLDTVPTVPTPRWCSPGVAGPGLRRATRLVHLFRWAGEVWGTETGVRCAEGARAPGGCPGLTAQPAGGIPPVTARAAGSAEGRVGLQALAGHLGVAALAGVTDAGAEEQPGRDEAVALGEDPVGRGGRRSARRAGCWAPAGPPPQDGPAPPGSHGLSSSSQRGEGGHREAEGVVGAGDEGRVAVVGGPVGAQQLPGTSQSLAMS